MKGIVGAGHVLGNPAASAGAPTDTSLATLIANNGIVWAATAGGPYEVIVVDPILNGGNPLVLSPTGAAVSTIGTTTDGIQEAINYAVANGYNVFIAGGSGTIGSTGFFKTTSGILFPSGTVSKMTTFSLRSNGATISVGSGVSVGLTIDSCSNCFIELPGDIIIGNNSGTAILINPVHTTNGAINTGANTFKFGFLSGPGGSNSATAMLLAATTATGVGIISNNIYLDGLAGFGTNLAIDDPSNGNDINSNIFYGGFFHAGNAISQLMLSKNNFVISDSIANTVTGVSLTGSAFTFENSTLQNMLVAFDTGGAATCTVVLNSGYVPSSTVGVLTLGNSSSGNVFLRSGSTLVVTYTGTPVMKYMTF